MANEWMEVANEWKRLYQQLKERIAILESNYNPEPKKKKRPNDIGLKILDGGQKFEDNPPFASNP